MLIIGSVALIHHFPHLDRQPNDTDFICTFEQFQFWTKFNKPVIRKCVPLSSDKFHVVDENGHNYEFEIAWPDSVAEKLLKYEIGCGWDEKDSKVVEASKETLLALKLSHRYLKNNPFFLKTMRDIQFLRGEGVELSFWLQEWLVEREKETYNYSHPKLNVTSKEFFTDDVPYIYSHDALHEVLAVEGEPAYKSYMKEDSQVMVDMVKFFTIDERTRLLGGLEESLVLCSERSLIPHDFKPDPDRMFEFALQKLCTSISSGRFREFCWENYDKIVDIYNKECKDNWVAKLKIAIENNSIALHGEK